MKKLLAILAFILLASWAQAQTGNTVLIRFPGVPTGDCSAIMVAVDDATGDYYDCDAAGNWFKVGPGGGGGSQHKVNGVNLTSNDPINFVDGVITFTNPSAGNITAFCPTCLTGFPRLDQVLDPTADKTFTMVSNLLSFNWGYTGLGNPGLLTLNTAQTSSVYAAVSVESKIDTASNPNDTVGIFVSPVFTGNSTTASYENFYSTGFSGPPHSPTISAYIDFYADAEFDTGTISTYKGFATNHGERVGFDSVYDFFAGPSTTILGATAPLNEYGLFVSDKTFGSVTRYAIKTGLGQVDFGDVTNAPRFKSSGTALVAGDFVLSAGWGNTASVGSISGTDQAFSFTVTATGVGQADSPTATLTFTDGTWTTAPVHGCKQIGGTGIQSDLEQAPTATTIVLTWLAIPTAAATYTFNCTGMGI